MHRPTLKRSHFVSTKHLNKIKITCIPKVQFEQNSYKVS